MASSAVTKNEPAGLPDLVPTRDDDFQIDARDIQPPRLKVASPTTGAVENGARQFSLFSEKGKDDSQPVELVAPGEGTEPGTGLKIYVLKMYKTLAANVDPSDWTVEKPKGGELRRWKIDDESAPPFARVQYNYVCYVPEGEDSDLPYNLLLANTSTPAARFINTVLGQQKQLGAPLYATAFELWPVKREREQDGTTNRWAIFKARLADSFRDEVQAASALYSQIVARPRPNLDQDDAPAASGAPSI
jgi:hypothetical protein